MQTVKDALLNFLHKNFSLQVSIIFTRLTDTSEDRLLWNKLD